MGGRRFRFGPHPQAGWLLGLRGSQLAGVGVAGLVALAVLRMSAPLSIVFVLVDVAVALLVVGVRFAGHTVVEWVPVAVAFSGARYMGADRWRSDQARAGHLTTLAATPGVDPQPVAAAVSLPAELADVELLETTLERFGGVALGVAYDKRCNTYTAVVRCEARAFFLLGPEEQEALLAAFGSLLAQLSADGSAIRRIAWYERTLPPGSDELVQYLHEHRRPDITDDDRGLRATWQLLSSQGHGATDHEVLVAAQIDARRLAARRRIEQLGGGRNGALALVADQISALVDELTRIGVQGAGPVGARNPAVPSARGLAAILRNGVDPFGRAERQRGEHAGMDGIGAESFGPRARDTTWSHVQADGALHVTGHLLEWPKHDVRATFLQDLLMGRGAQCTRTVAMVMDVMGPASATRRAERASEEASAEGWLRRRIGKRTTARDRQREGFVNEREHELAAGHALVQFAGFVTVSVPVEHGLSELQAQFAAVQARALAAGLRLEAMHGEQQEALTYTLPLCRGLA
jgi:hypothetical protein